MFEDYSDDEFVTNFRKAPSIPDVPSAMINFSLELPDGQRPQDVLSGLMSLYRDLAEHGLRFPRFSLACIRYLKFALHLNADQIKSRFPSAEVDLVSGLLGFFDETGVANLVTSIFGFAKGKIGQWVREQKLVRELTEKEVREIFSWDLETDLRNNLPRLFAEDLNEALKQAQETGTF